MLEEHPGRPAGPTGPRRGGVRTYGGAAAPTTHSSSLQELPGPAPLSEPPLDGCTSLVPDPGITHLDTHPVYPTLVPTRTALPAYAVLHAASSAVLTAVSRVP